jgi:hypothetical protein
MNIYQTQIGVARLSGLFPEGHKVISQAGDDDVFKFWKQRGFSSPKVVFVDPKSKPTGELKSLKPNPNVTLIFTTTPNKDWVDWIKKNQLELKVKKELTKDKIVGVLMSDKKPLGDFYLTQSAAEFVADVFYEESIMGLFSIAFTLSNCRPENKVLLDLEDVIEIWPDENLKLANKISNVLGTKEAVTMYMAINKETADIFGLWRYLDIVCQFKHVAWLHLSHAYRSAADKKYLPYRTALMLFIIHCTKQRKGVNTNKMLRDFCNIPG